MGSGVQGSPRVAIGWFLSEVFAHLSASDLVAMLGLPKLITFPCLISFFHLRFLGEFGLTETKMLLVCLILMNRTCLDTVYVVHLSTYLTIAHDHMINFLIKSILMG